MIKQLAKWLLVCGLVWGLGTVTQSSSARAAGSTGRLKLKLIRMFRIIGTARVVMPTSGMRTSQNDNTSWLTGQ